VTRLTGRNTLLLNAMAALNTANAWTAFDRKTPASVGAFAAGWPTSELPLPTLGAHLALNALAARRGAFRGAGGMASTGLALGVSAGLIGLETSARAAGSLFSSALHDALGPDFALRVRHPRFPGPQAATARTPGVVRMARIRRRFVQDQNIDYGPDGRANQLDVWRRQDLPVNANAPVLLQFPGGAWTTGNKQGQAYPLMSHLAERGWICVAANYRLGPRHSWPAQIIDVKRTIAWTRRHIADYGGDPNFVAVTGGSAGGHLSALAALTPNVPEWQPGFAEVDTSVSAAVPFYGAYDFTNRTGEGHHSLIPHLERRVMKAKFQDAFELFDDASPLSRVHPQAPPFLISHGVNDSMIPVEQARTFVAALRAVSRSPVAYAELPHAQHAFDIFGTPRATGAAEATAQFLGVVYGQYLESQSANAVHG
jgi:acetyl esterase/lipase